MSGQYPEPLKSHKNSVNVKKIHIRKLRGCLLLLAGGAGGVLVCIPPHFSSGCSNLFFTAFQQQDCSRQKTGSGNVSAEAKHF
jgi:hypothetical protein